MWRSPRIKRLKNAYRAGRSSLLLAIKRPGRSSDITAERAMAGMLSLCREGLGESDGVTEERRACRSDAVTTQQGTCGTGVVSS